MNLLCAGAEKFFSPGSVIESLFFFWTIIDQDVADASFKLMHSIPLQVSFGPVDQSFQKKTQFFRGKFEYVSIIISNTEKLKKWQEID